MGEKKITVFIPEINGVEWQGGKLYFENLQKIVSAYFPEVRFLASDFGKPVYSPPAPGLLTRIGRKLKGYDPAAVKKKMTEQLRSKAYVHYRELAGDSTPVLFTNLDITYSGKLPFIFWLPDFQFLHLPGFAEKDYIERCHRQAKTGIANATLVMLSSTDAKNDLSAFTPEHSAKARVVSFVRRIDPALLQNDPRDVLAKYHLPERFFYVPNQFWKHKNHELVLEALVLLAKEGIRPFVVFSGHTNDFRNPRHFDKLLRFVSENNLRGQVAFLGMIDYADVVRLVRQSMAVINPSRFEGWSTTVEEVKSIGKKMLLSDLAVHKEQAPATGLFFGREDAAALAALMKEAEKTFAPGVDAVAESRAAAEFTEREKKFAVQFRALLDEACAQAGA